VEVLVSVLSQPRTEDSRGLPGRREVVPVNPGHRPSASALGFALPARWAGLLGAFRTKTDRCPPRGSPLPPRGRG
jgi:hypothetical protein